MSHTTVRLQESTRERLKKIRNRQDKENLDEAIIFLLDYYDSQQSLRKESPTLKIN